MNSKDYIAKRYSQLFTDIDTQINQLSSCSLITLHSNDFKSFKNSDSKITQIQIENVVQAAKEFDTEIKNFVKQNGTEKKTKIKPKPVSMKSTIPPIWNDTKLKTYIENVMNELDIPSEENQTEMDTQIIFHPKSILKKNICKNEAKRNVGTNVKFLSPNTPQKNLEQSSKYKATMTEPIDKHTKKKKDKAPCKNHQTIKTNDLEIEYPLTKTSGTLLCEQQRVMNCDKSLQQPSKSNRPQSAPSKLVFAPITLTSTTDKGENDDIVMLAESNLATTTHDSYIKQHMTKCVLPVLSIKGKCTIQRIYQLEILPTRDLQLNEQYVAKNVHFHEYRFESDSNHRKNVDNEKSCESNDSVKQDIKKLNLNGIQHIQLASSTHHRENSPLKPLPHDPQQPIQHDEISATLSTFQNVLNGIKINNGKIHVVLEKPVERKKKKFLRKKIHSNLSRKSRTKTEIVSKKLDIKKDDDSTSSMSDDKVREFLGCEKRKVKNSSSNSSAEPCSSPVSASSMNDPHETSLNNEFKSFYELFTQTFEESSNREVHNEQKREIEIQSGLTRMREIITLSEENIKKAEELLQKYQHIKKSEEEIKMTNDECLQTSDVEKITLPQSPLKNIEISPPEIPSKVDSFAQTTIDVNLQNDGLKSRHYFKHVYDKYSNFNNINFNQPPISKPHQSTSTTSALVSKYLNDTVPFNTSYCDNDEVMQLADKFLKSVEKRKKKFSISDDISSSISSLDLNDRGSEISLSLSDFSSKTDKSAKEVEIKEQKELTEKDLKDLLSGIDAISDDDGSSSISSSMLGF